ncbi:hypothetical protein [Kocuria sp. KH4]
MFGLTEAQLMGWSMPPLKTLDRYEAGKWLNRLLNTAESQAGPLEWVRTPGAVNPWPTPRERDTTGLPAVAGSAP